MYLSFNLGFILLLNTNATSKNDVADCLMKKVVGMTLGEVPDNINDLFTDFFRLFL